MTPEKTETGKVSDDYLKTLEEVKKQYRQYAEVSDLYKLPIHKEEETIQYQPPSPEHPLTTDTVARLFYMPRPIPGLPGAAV